MNRILLFIKTPPPVTGATLMNKRVCDSKLLRSSFNIRAVQISYMNKLDEMGRKSFKKFLIMIKVFLKLFSELVFHRPAFVYFQISPHGMAYVRDLIYVILIKMFRVKIVYHLHGKGINDKLGNKLKRFFYQYTFAKENVICLSSLLTYDIEKVYNKKPYIVPNGLPELKISTATSQRNNNSAIRLLFLSNLIFSKGILDFIEALCILMEKKINFEAIIVGAESDLNTYQINEIITQKSLNDFCSYIGPKYDTEKEDILTSSDIIIFPTKNDIWGNIILEAMQYNIPVIATREGAIPEIIDDGVTGFIVDKNAPDQIAEKIEFLINNPEKRFEMGKAGRKKFLEKYTIDKFEKNMKNVFDEICG